VLQHELASRETDQQQVEERVEAEVLKVRVVERGIKSEMKMEMEREMDWRSKEGIRARELEDLLEEKSASEKQKVEQMEVMRKEIRGMEEQRQTNCEINEAESNRMHVRVC